MKDFHGGRYAYVLVVEKSVHSYEFTFEGAVAIERLNLISDF